MKFKAGDRFIVKASESDLGATGKITGIGFNSIRQSDEYRYVWDQQFGGSTGSCDTEVGDSMWDIIAADIHTHTYTHVYTIPEDNYTISVGNIVWNNPTSNSTNCSHEYKMYNGFTESYEFCIKCDKRKI
jgi:hypothetical protein